VVQFKEKTLRVEGMIKYETTVAVFCCEQIKLALYRGDYVYNSEGLRRWGEDSYLDTCPYCGKD